MFLMCYWITEQKKSAIGWVFHNCYCCKDMFLMCYWINMLMKCFVDISVMLLMINSWLLYSGSLLSGRKHWILTYLSVSCHPIVQSLVSFLAFFWLQLILSIMKNYTEVEEKYTFISFCIMLHFNFSCVIFYCCYRLKLLNVCV